MASPTAFFMGTRLFNQPALYWGIIAVLFAIIWIFTYPKQYEKLLKKQMKKMLREGDNSSIFSEKLMIIDHEKIQVSDEFTTEIILRKNIKSIKVYEGLVMIYLSGLTAQVVPTKHLGPELREKLLEELNYC